MLKGAVILNCSHMAYWRFFYYSKNNHLVNLFSFGGGRGVEKAGATEHLSVSKGIFFLTEKKSAQRHNS